MTVYLVGAGPGDPGLLTVRGRNLLTQADVVLYDGLVDGRVLEHVRPGATRLDVGKVAANGEHRGAARQDEITALLLRYGRTHACVVRLKGGDPFVFGRGGEEALALAAAGIPFEVVPGVSSVIAVPAYAGIPVTHRGLAASVAVVTGHEATGKSADASAVDWRRLATATDTLVIAMGVARLPAIVEQLMVAGRSPRTPAAIVERGTSPQQRTVRAALADLPGAAAAAGVHSPATVIVGEVVRLSGLLAWYEPHGAPAAVTDTVAVAATLEARACA